MVRNELLKTLKNAGLTNLQAKVYIMLAKSEQASTKKISTYTKIDRGNVYRTLSDLERLGLVERILSNPIIFKAIPLNEGLRILLKRKLQEYNEFQKSMEDLLKVTVQDTAEPNLQKDTYQFVLIPEKETLVFKIKKAIEKAENSIDWSTTWKRFPQGLFLLGDDLMKALKRDVAVRCIVNKPAGKSWPKILSPLAQNTRFELVSISDVPVVLFIFDKKEAFQACFSAGEAASAPSLWSNNANFIEIIQNYFDTKWDRSYNQVWG